MYSRHTERTDNAEGVHPTNGSRTKQTETAKGVHSTNGNKATGCILYRTRVLCHRSTQSLIQRLGASFCTYSCQNVLISRLLTAFFIFYRLSSVIKTSVCRMRWLILPCTQQTETHRVFTRQTGIKLKCTVCSLGKRELFIKRSFAFM